MPFWLEQPPPDREDSPRDNASQTQAELETRNHFHLHPVHAAAAIRERLGEKALKEQA